MIDKFAGLRTFFVGLLMAVVPAATSYLGIVDWNSVFSFLGPHYSSVAAMVVGGLVMILMRSITSTPPLIRKDGSKHFE